MLKCLSLMKINKQLSTKQFIVSHLLILTVSLIFLFGIYYILNIQYRQSKDPFSNGPVTTAPKTLRLDLDHPDHDSLTFQSSIIVSGQTAPGKEILIFTDSQDLILTSKKDGSFSTILNLDEGVNKITAVVIDSTGDSRSVERSVYYSEEKL